MVLAATPNQVIIRAETVLVAPRTIKKESMALMSVTFRSIRADINGPFLLSKSYIAAATHD